MGNSVCKGGVGEILATILIAGLVVALILSIVLPIVSSTKDAGTTARGRILEIIGNITGEE